MKTVKVAKKDVKKFKKIIKEFSDWMEQQTKLAKEIKEP